MNNGGKEREEKREKKRWDERSSFYSRKETDLGRVNPVVNDQTILGAWKSESSHFHGESEKTREFIRCLSTCRHQHVSMSVDRTSGY